jgi:hypothetical protein
MNRQKEVLEILKSNASKRKQDTLNFLYKLLENHAKKGEIDFTIATIGRLSAAHGGPSTQAIRNKTGGEYRTLIEVFAATAQPKVIKRPAKTSRALSLNDEDILKKITEPALRAVVGSIIQEKNLARKELKVLKSQTSIVVDCRKSMAAASVLADETSTIEWLSVSGLLNNSEREALEDAISNRLFEQRGWTRFDNGRVKDEMGGHLYKPGYVIAIRKILTALDNG